MTLPEYTPDQLRERGSVKWTARPDALGAFVAESDFGTAPVVHRALAELSRQELFTYTPRWLTDRLRETTHEYYQRKFGWTVPAAQIAAVPDVITSYATMIDMFTAPGTPIVLLTPAYMPFFKIPPLRDREIREVPLTRTQTGWELDEPALEAALSGGALLVMCNPHNPLGKVYTRAELLRVSEIVDRAGSRVFSDEIHSPLLFEGRHIPYASVSPAAAAHTITAMSASKAFNVPGLKCAQMLFSNPEDAHRFTRLGEFTAHTTANPGIVANIAAYREGDAWLAELLTYLDGNRQALADQLAEKIPQAVHLPAHGTYIAWIDLRRCGLGDNPAQTLHQRAAVALTDGRECGVAGAGHVRLNTATPRAILTEIIDRMARAITG